MKLESRLAEEFLAAHPARAAVVLERLGLAPSTAFLMGASSDELALVIPALSPQFGAEVIRALPAEQVADMLAGLPLDVAARLARRLGDREAAVTERLPPDVADSLRSLLRFPPDTAGGLMDPRVLALPEELTAGEALERVRELPDSARYNLYVVDPEQVLVGVLNLRELFVARSEKRLSELMITHPHCLQAATGRAGIVSHPGWREAHAIPVVDEENRYLGAIRYRTLRELEATLASREENETSEALGELLVVAAEGLVRALTTPGLREGD